MTSCGHSVSPIPLPFFSVQRRMTSARSFNLPSPLPPDSPFLRPLGTTAALKAPPQTDTLVQRALEEWERTLAVAILAEVQAGQPILIHKDGGEMLIAIVLDRQLAEAKEPVDNLAAFTREMTRIKLGNRSPITSKQTVFIQTQEITTNRCFLEVIIPSGCTSKDAQSASSACYCPASSEPSFIWAHQ